MPNLPTVLLLSGQDTAFANDIDSNDNYLPSSNKYSDSDLNLSEDGSEDLPKDAAKKTQALDLDVNADDSEAPFKMLPKLEHKSCNADMSTY
jgi:hypothetical protein